MSFYVPCFLLSSGDNQQIQKTVVPATVIWILIYFKWKGWGYKVVLLERTFQKNVHSIICENSTTNTWEDIS